MTQWALALGTILLVAGCGSDGDGDNSNADTAVAPPVGESASVSDTPCKGAVGKPLQSVLDKRLESVQTEVRVTCTESGKPVGEPDGIGSCYTDGKLSGELSVYFSADEGLYFGKTGDVLHFKTGVPSMTEMREEIGNC